MIKIKIELSKNERIAYIVVGFAGIVVASISPRHLIADGFVVLLSALCFYFGIVQNSIIFEPERCLNWIRNKSKIE